MSGTFPGAPDLQEFWRNLLAGNDAVSFLSDEELEASGIDPSTYQNPRYVKAAQVFSRAPAFFDAPFFGFGRREAELMAPQHRVMLECAWASIEDAGHDP